MLSLKICGMKFPENITEVSRLAPEYLGFIFYPGSPRYFTGTIPEVNEKTKKTGIFVNPSLDFLRNKVEEHQLKVVQLHGEESPELCAASKSSNVEVIKVFSIKDGFDFGLLQSFEGKVDFFLFDTLGRARGGNGKTFDWEVLKNYSSTTPFFLSGGIGLGEVKRIHSLKTYFKKNNKERLFHGVDVNSRFEIEPGLKKLADLKTFQAALQ